VPLARVLSALVYHVMSAAGTLADGSISERRTRLPWEVIAQLMRLTLDAGFGRGDRPS